MTRFTDEQLMAFSDGDPAGNEVELAARASLSVEERRALEEFRRTRELVQVAFADDAAEAPSAALVSMILNRPSTGTAPASPHRRRLEGRVGHFFPRDRGRLLSRTAIGRGLAIAASVAMLIGAMFYWSIPGSRHEIAAGLTPGPVLPTSELAGVLETKRSGDPVRIGMPSDVERHLMVAATFRDRNARICREIEMLDADLAPRLAAVACRSAGNGTWHVEGVVAIARAPTGNDASYTPAGASEKQALDALMALLGAKEAVRPDEEQNLIGRAWK